MKKFFLGDEHTGLKQDRIKWITETFEQSRYWFVDEGYFHYERYVLFDRNEDALLYSLRWS